MGFKRILAAAVLSALIAGNVTAFAEETVEKYDYPAIFEGEEAKEKINELSEKLDTLSELAENLADSKKAEYKELVSSVAEEIEEYIKNIPSDSYAEQAAFLNEKLRTVRDSIYERIAEIPNVRVQEEFEDIKDTVSGLIKKIGKKAEESSDEEFALHADETEFVWDRNSEAGITVKTNSSSREFTVKKNGSIYSSSLINHNLLIDSGAVYLESGFLKKLDDGENKIELMLKEGNIVITVNVTNNGTEIPVENGEITAEKSYFEWDKSDLTGIVVNTNSKSKSVLLKKDGEMLLTDGERGVYIALGRVGITARVLKKLDVGENRLTLEFDDGTAEITVSVTDKKHSSPEEITADKTEFTWDRNSGESIVIKTTSKSESVSVRQDGKIFSKSDRENISVIDGTVTIKPEFLNKLNNGENELKLIFDDGNISVKINVTGENSKASKTSYESSVTESKGLIGILPDTGSRGFSFAAGAAALSALITGILLSRKKRKLK